MGLLEQIPAVLYFFVPAYVANMSPVLVRNHFHSLAAPIDGGLTWRGQRVLGDHKTWRGLIAGILVAPLVLEFQIFLHRAGYLHELALIDYASCSAWLGVLLGTGTGLGDSIKSFFKRQIGIAPGRPWVFFDQVDFLFGAYAFVCLVYVPPLLATLACLPIVFLGSLAVTATAAWLGMKESWL
ncbi:MAG: CDP-archaeol synthase [Deltaproteobacteria bacterium]|nr:CDP-archaeol synthase [Deltaproteobacteria bacterium]